MDNFIYQGDYNGADTDFRFEYQGMTGRKTAQYKVYRETDDCFIYCTRVAGVTHNDAIDNLNEVLQRWDAEAYA